MMERSLYHVRWYFNRTALNTLRGKAQHKKAIMAYCKWYTPEREQGYLSSFKMDTMWPSSAAAERIMERLGEKEFSYPYQHLNYDYGGHLFVPMEIHLAKAFKGDRGKYKELSRKARMDSLTKTLKFVSRW